MTPIAKNILVVDESGKTYTSTYAKRAQGLVKHGRARWLDEQTICLACPPDTVNLEDNNMENREDMQVVTVGQQAQEEQLEQDVQKKAADAPVTEREILARIDRIIAQGEELAKAVESIRDLPVSDSMSTTGDISARVEAISSMYIAREETNRKQLELLREMYEDMRQTDPLSAKKEILEMIRKIDFVNVSPETAKNVLDFYQRQLENL